MFLTKEETKIQDLYIVETNSIKDQRGSFARLFCVDELEDVLNERKILQINHSSTTKIGTIRGMHFQRSPFSEMKLIRCIRGCVWDVAVDVRIDSPTFLEWHAEEISPENNKMMIIPEGCAHGFQVLEENSKLLYLHTNRYQPDAESGLRYDDPKLGIDWPIEPVNISKRDKEHKLIDNHFLGINC